MLDNEFDQYFRDRLLNHSSKVKISIWKRVHVDLLRHKQFHFWKWYFVGPSAVVLAVVGHLVLAKPNKPVYIQLNTSTSTARITATTPASTLTRTPTAASASTAITPNTPSPYAIAIRETPTTRASKPTTRETSAASQAHWPGRHTNLTTHHARRPGDLPIFDALIEQTATAQSRTVQPRTAQSRITQPHTAQPQTAQPQTAQSRTPGARPQFAGPVKLAQLNIYAQVTANTPNPKALHQLTLPSLPQRVNSHAHLEIFGSPEYYTWKTLGVSYSAGFRATVIYKDHWTFTSGLQYLRTNISHTTAKDSLNGLIPGYLENYHVPVLLGYITGNHRFSYSVNAGAIFSFYANSKFTSPYATSMPNPNGVTLYFGLGFSSRVIERISLFAEPHIKCWLPPGDMNLPPQLWSIGLSVGMRYNF